jgi:tetratricopeptide (TPR) repeat protein
MHAVVRTSVMAGALLLPSLAFAQSGQEYLDFLRRCEEAGGISVGDASNPNCAFNNANPSPPGPSPEEIARQAAQQEAYALHNAALALWNDANVVEKDWDRIIALLEQALALWPDNQSIAENLQIARGNRQGVLERHEQQRIYQNYSQAFQVGREAFEQRRWEDAIRSFEDALYYYPSDPPALTYLQMARDALGKDQAAPLIAEEINRHLEEVLLEPIGTEASGSFRSTNFETIETAIEAFRLADDVALPNRDRIEAAVKLLAAPWMISNPVLNDAYQRAVYLEQARNELKDIMKQTLFTTTELMIEDVKKLEPFKWNPFGAEQRRVIERMEKQIVDMRTGGENEIASGDLFRDDATASVPGIAFRPGPALRQLQKIQMAALWEGR